MTRLKKNFSANMMSMEGSLAMELLLLPLYPPSVRIVVARMGVEFGPGSGTLPGVSPIGARRIPSMTYSETFKAQMVLELSRFGGRVST